MAEKVIATILSILYHWCSVMLTQWCRHCTTSTNAYPRLNNVLSSLLIRSDVDLPGRANPEADFTDMYGRSWPKCIETYHRRRGQKVILQSRNKVRCRPVTRNDMTRASFAFPQRRGQRSHFTHLHLQLLLQMTLDPLTGVPPWLSELNLDVSVNWRMLLAIAVECSSMTSWMLPATCRLDSCTLQLQV